jgi:malonyl-CoA/methylmalonyl-CoA synthetase
VFKGYWRRADASGSDFRSDGFFITGDLGMIRPDGHLQLVGRKKDLIISGGYNVYAVEVESALNGIVGVRESAVIGVPHPDFGEAVMAILVSDDQHAAPSSTEVLGSIKGSLANYKLPKSIAFVDELPRNAMGKVLKATLRSQFRATFAVA